MCIITGDSIDNGLVNEMTLLIDILTQQHCSPSKRLTSYFGVQSDERGDAFYWHPSSFDDLTKTLLGYPSVDGMMDAISMTYKNEPLKVPWLLSNGNHESLIQGLGFHSDEVVEFAIGSLKPVGFTDTLDLVTTSELFRAAPEKVFSQLKARPIKSELASAKLSALDFIAAVKNAPGQPIMHGFTNHGPHDERVYFSYIDAEKRCLYIFLDTAVRSSGAHDGIDLEQFNGLKTTLDLELRESGSVVKMVIIAFHHGLDEITDESMRYVSSDVILTLIHSHHEIKLWLCGHTHKNEVRAYPNAQHPGLGFFQIATASLMDWPCTTRTIEVFEHSDGSSEIELTVHRVSRAKPDGSLDVKV